ncbi:MmcQ/YjbR family DNA-binding protein [Phenylobacterium sp.]|uniref:MmcQ/YjbR family DNA-binding protein n=1 Tax=Phenylobacterium sp. TaxID=1871053 RepID=UPI0027347032|nr:MmcQ/YjbR family DNA-binding protein [Phenylobacterium sp.]MDP3855029.1 MmcQ/YjbR family DNA-binding protein [Phenylobacterium sp.]
MTPDALRSVALALPGTDEGFNMGSVVFKVNGKVLCRLLSDDVAMFTGVGFDEREMLMEARPDVFHITPHYRDYPGMLVNLGPLDPVECASFLEKRWRQIAPKQAANAFDAGKA